MPVDYKRAMAAHKIGAEGGNAVCQYNLGAMYYKGLPYCDEPSMANAVKWLTKAKQAGVPGASKELKVVQEYIKQICPLFGQDVIVHDLAQGLSNVQGVVVDCGLATIRIVSNERLVLLSGAAGLMLWISEKAFGNSELVSSVWLPFVGFFYLAFIRHVNGAGSGSFLDLPLELVKAEGEEVVCTVKIAGGQTTTVAMTRVKSGNAKRD